MIYTLHWRHNGRDGVSNDQPHDCLLKRLFRRRSKETSKLRVTAARTGEVPAQMASNVENAVTGYLCLYVWLMKKNTINLFCCPQD